MIVFLNFAPIEFMGGVERSVYHLFGILNKSEKTKIISVHPRISNLYSRLVLKRRFDKRADLRGEKERREIIGLSYRHFIPFTSAWFEIRRLLSKARVIYFKFELPEICILLYFAGIPGLRKSIAGIRSPLVYAKPREFFDYLHNIVYRSFYTRRILSHVKLVHVMNMRDKVYLEKRYRLRSIIYIPNSIAIKRFPQSSLKSVTSDLKIIFVGELNFRKGIDILSSIVKHSPKHFQFSIVGDGPLQPGVKELASDCSNCTYFSYQDRSRLDALYEENDVLLLPSRAETFGRVMIEGMKHELKIVNSVEVSLDLPGDIEYSSKTSSSSEYLELLERIYLEKRNKGIDGKRIYEYCYEHFSEEIIDERLKRELFMRD